MNHLRLRLLAAALVLALPWAEALSQEVPKPARVRTRPLLVTVGSTVRLQMSTKLPIRSVVNENDKVVRVQAVPDDPTTVLVTGLAPGVTRIILTARDGTKESRQIGKP